MNNSRVRYIDTWRFFAIALVIISHIIEFSHPIYRETFPGLIWRIHPLGRLGVHIFFCLSGYVICRGMMNEVARSGSLSMRDFYFRRVCRIFPPLFLYLLLLALMTAAGIIDMSIAQFTQSALFLCNIEMLGGCGWYAAHTWSLAYEEQFYLIFPMLFVGLAIARKRRKLLNVIGVLIAIVLLAHLAGQPALAYYLSIFNYMLWGCAFALYEHKAAPLLKRMPVALWYAGCAVLLGVNFIALPALLMEVVYPLAAPLIICAVVFGTPLHQRPIGKLFGFPFLAYLGQISYTIYLWQQAATKDHGFASPLVVFGFLGFVFVLAHFSYKYVEIPLIRLGRRLSRHEGTVPTSTPAQVNEISLGQLSRD
ncbi:peptidoglycan/LPS O-acetylase OafA/YrhL [Massilia sp. MP_M2]|uniref:acyltransferase family protein n=1 Tax=Massilia sp. MP_M2 TaxID=3071713 RepID=UPI00319DFE93